MAELVLGRSGHGYTSHALNKLYLQQALEGTNASSPLILSGIISTKNSPGAIMGRLVILMVSAGIEELCKVVSFEKGAGNYAGWDEDAINYTLRKYQAHYAAKEELRSSSPSSGSHYLLEGWQPSEPYAENGENTDPTLAQPNYLENRVSVENRRSVGALVSGSYAAGCFDPANHD
eukprot:7999843-Heterocapsa_arctica.AAC.1